MFIHNEHIIYMRNIENNTYVWEKIKSYVHFIKDINHRDLIFDCSWLMPEWHDAMPCGLSGVNVFLSKWQLIIIIPSTHYRMYSVPSALTSH